MIDNTYKDAFKEVYDILQNTDEELLNKIPNKFMQFIKNNMNAKYKTNIQINIEIDKQKLLKETEGILALIYRSYWATDIEKLAFANRDKKELIANEERKKKESKDINEIFEQRKNIDKITLDNNLMIIQKESFIKKFINKILRIFQRKQNPYD